MSSSSSPCIIPPSLSTVDVFIIDTSFRLSDLSTSLFLGPEIKGFDNYRAIGYAFLITHTDYQTGKKTKVLFDLGPPKDWEHDLAPALVERITGWGATIKIDMNVSEILENNGVPLGSIDAIIWRYVSFCSLIHSKTVVCTFLVVHSAFAEQKLTSKVTRIGTTLEGQVCFRQLRLSSWVRGSSRPSTPAILRTRHHQFYHGSSPAGM